MKNRVCIITGGCLSRQFLTEFLKKEKFQKVMAVDNGLKWCDELNIVPDYIVGDFDTVNKKLLRKYEKNEKIQIERLNPHKDDSDTEHALWHVISCQPDEIVLLGGLGNRMDHAIANIYSLQIPLQYHIPAYLVDEKNRISLIKRDKVLRKQEQYGKYFSIMPFSDEVRGVTITGAAYPVEEKDFTRDDSFSLGVSNEIVGEEAHISIREGMLLLLETKD